MGKVSQLAEDICFLQSPGRAFLAISGTTTKTETVDWGWLGFFFLAQPFHPEVLNDPEKASQRQRGKASGYSGSVQIPPCSCRSGICFRLIAFPRSSFSCAGSLDAQMDKMFPEHFRQEPPQKMLPPRCASSAGEQGWGRILLHEKGGF